MSESADIAARTQRFNDAVRAFTPPSPTRHAKLMPLKDGIVELRQKGASLRMIRELLATVGVAVSTDTIARFLAEVNGEPASERLIETFAAPSCRHRSSAFHHNRRLRLRFPRPQAESPPERPRTRGPRIADPRNL